MIFFEDTNAERPRIEAVIRKHGYAAEHNFDWYQYCCDVDDRNIFAQSEQGEGGLLTTQHKGDNEIFGFMGPVAPESRRLPILLEYLDAIFPKQPKAKIWLELEMPLRKEFLQALPERYHANRVNYSLTWPVMDLAAYDPAMPGGGSKAMRKEKHKFYRNHTVEIADAKTFEDRVALENIIDRWMVKRPTHDKVWEARYRNAVRNRFAGMEEARVFIVDGTPAGINAGWMIPNSNRFYGGIGIHNYSADDLGLVLYWEDLDWLKSRGYREADMGGTWGTAIYFKDKFHPVSHYKTFIFSVIKK